MANIKSAEKRIHVIRTKTLRNKMIKSRVKTAEKKFLTAINAGNKAVAEAALLTAISEVDKAKSKGIFHANTASRKVSRLTLILNKMN